MVLLVAVLGLLQQEQGGHQTQEQELPGTGGGGGHTQEGRSAAVPDTRYQLLDTDTCYAEEQCAGTSQEVDKCPSTQCRGQAKQSRRRKWSQWTQFR